MEKISNPIPQSTLATGSLEYKLEDYEKLVDEIQNANNPAQLPDQIKELNLIITYLCEHSKIMDRNYIKSRIELDAETLELTRSRAYILEDIEQLKLKLKNCNELCDEAALIEAEIKDCEVLTRNIPERKSLRTKQKSEMEDHQAEIIKIEQGNLKLVEEIDISDHHGTSLRSDCDELEKEIAAKTEQLRQLQYSDKILEEHKQQIQDSMMLERVDIEKEITVNEELIHDKKVTIKQLEQSTDLMRNKIGNLTNTDNEGSFDKYQQDMSTKIIQLQSEVADLHIKFKNTLPKISEDKVDEAIEQLQICKDKIGQIEAEKLKKMNTQQLLLRKRVDERPKMEALMKENMQWEILEAKHNLDMLKAEKAKYEVKLEELYVQSQVAGYEFSRVPYNAELTRSDIE